MKSLDSTQLAVMLLSLALLIGVARILGELARRFHQPAILGELLAGLILGPTVFGWLAPSIQAFVFPQEGPNALVLDGIYSLSIALYLLVAGMEVDLSTVWKQGGAALKVGILGTIVPFVIGLIAATSFPGVLGGGPAESEPFIFSLFLATAMSISALPVIAKTLRDLNLYRTNIGMLVVSAAIFNDLVGWTLFALILGLMGTHSAGIGIVATISLTILFVLMMLTVGRSAMHRVLPFLETHTHIPQVECWDFRSPWDWWALR